MLLSGVIAPFHESSGKKVARGRNEPTAKFFQPAIDGDREEILSG